MVYCRQPWPTCWSRERDNYALFFTYCQHDTVGSIIPGKDFSARGRDQFVHALRHLGHAHKTVLFSGVHLAKTYTYVFIPPSAVLAIVNVYSYSFSHDEYFFIIPAKAGIQSFQYVLDQGLCLHRLRGHERYRQLCTSSSKMIVVLHLSSYAEYACRRPG